MTFLSVNAGTLHYQRLNSATSDGHGGPCQIFLHGMIMDNLSSWFFTLANPASQIGPVLLYDLRGHGFSERPRTGYAIADHLEDLRQLIASVGGDGPVVLIGNSYGGLLALNFAAKYPELVAGLVLVDAQINDAAWTAQMLSSLGLQGESRNQMIAKNFQHWLGRSSERKSQRLIKNAHELIYETTLLDDLEAEAVMTDDDLRRITAPCFAIYGGDSDILGVAERLERVLPDCTLRVLAGCSHSVLWEQTDLVKSMILTQLAHWQAVAGGAAERTRHLRVAGPRYGVR